MMSGDSSRTRLLSAKTLRAALGLPEREPPFPWQERLLSMFVAGEIPRALDIPTGLGKTSVIAIWLVARAAGALIPRRLVYVVDRRAVVDQATQVAERLRAFVEQEPELKRALGLETPLPISTLRGQFVDNKQWLEDPSTPAIVLGTVDMVGSRLLFSGYGVSPKMRPYHAGFLGADTLIVLDEAHLAQPFERLLEQIAEGADARGCSLSPAAALAGYVPRLQCMSLSATGRERGASEVFRLNADDREHPVVKRRLSAVKRLVLRDGVAERELSDVLAAEAWALSEHGNRPVRVIIFCNSREHAQSTREALKKRATASDAIDVELFVGARRVFERELAAGWLAERGFIAGTKAEPSRPSFVIATSAGEVGVDLDADHAVCDLVAWERMVQRFGRVNRRGERQAEVTVVPMLRDVKTEQPNEQALRVDAARALIPCLRERHGGYDVSPDGLSELRSRAKDDAALAELLQRATTPALLHPPMARAHVEAWSMTSLDEHTGRPEVAPWIRGWPEEEEEPQTTVVWRTHLPVVDGRQLLDERELSAFREAADPHLAERLECETWRLLAWLIRRVSAARIPEVSSAGVSSVEGKAAAGDGGEVAFAERSFLPDEVVAVLLDSRAGDRVVFAAELSDRDQREELARDLQGATLVVDRRLRGLRSGLLADDAEEEVRDVTEVGSSAGGENGVELRVVPFRIRSIREGERAEGGYGWRTEARLPLQRTDEGVSTWLLVESQMDHIAESEEGRSAARRAQLLDEHQEWVEREARRIGERLGLPREALEALAVAARLHDEGKQAARWQRAFRAASDGKPPFYAKTTSAPDFKVLDGYRHELGSLPYAEAHPRVKALPHELRELCLHLVAAHHGYARPLIRTSGATEPPTRLVERAQQIALRFAELERRWGPWGLAWWEALLRAADQQASRRNDLEVGSNG